ncbi:hypothetical protein [Nocardia carnea]|uniref:hypothetical protein n=1 Tax=Nocardia carnea TaxID=37328 RepID=UPI0024590636|nr:hypothetical protein [Nocardia carnea]
MPIRHFVQNLGRHLRPRQRPVPATDNDGRYVERSSMLAVLAAIWPAVLATNDPEMPGCAILYIATPNGQISYHIHDRDLPIFHAANVEVVAADDPRARWDHSGKEEHNRRLQKTAADLAHSCRYSYRWTDTGTGHVLHAYAATASDARILTADLRARQHNHGIAPDAVVLRHLPDDTATVVLL